MLTKTISLRLAGPEDAQTISKMISDLALSQNHAGEVRTSSLQIQKQMTQEKPPFECLLAEVDGVPAGFALFYSFYSTWEGRNGIFLEDLFVCARHRRLGLGKQLLAALTETARARGCTRVDWMVQDDNHGAQTFYENLGARSLPNWSRWRLELPADQPQTF